MITEKIIYGSSVDAVFEQIMADFTSEPDLLSYNTLIEQEGKKILLDIDIDPGGGFEGGFETTTITAPLQKIPGFRFAIHHEGFLDEIGKFFGMQDVITGYAEFDKKVIVKTNDDESVKKVFEDAAIRSTFGSLHGYTLEITTHDTASEHHAPFLEFTIERGIVDAAELKTIYSAFLNVLNRIDQLPSGD